jgi:hypothetical protein
LTALSKTKNPVSFKKEGAVYWVSVGDSTKANNAARGEKAMLIYYHGVRVPLKMHPGMVAGYGKKMRRAVHGCRLPYRVWALRPGTHVKITRAMNPIAAPRLPLLFLIP